MRLDRQRVQNFAVIFCGQCHDASPFAWNGNLAAALHRPLPFAIDEDRAMVRTVAHLLSCERLASPPAEYAACWSIADGPASASVAALHACGLPRLFARDIFPLQISSRGLRCAATLPCHDRRG